MNNDKQTCRGECDLFFIIEIKRLLDLDECSMITNLCQYQCINTLGSYECICPPGFSLERNRQCRDVDECQLGIHNCSADDICVNIRGGFRCIHIDCPTGYDKIRNK